MKSEKTPWLSGSICGWDVKVNWKMVTFEKWGDKCAFEFEFGCSMRFWIF